MISIRKAVTSQEIAEAIAVQLQVFFEEQEIPEDLCREGNENAVHLLALENEKAIGTARLRIQDNGEAELARIAVLSGYRSSGIGKRLVGQLESVARESGASQIVLYPHAYLESFYTSLGFSKTDEETGDVGEHPLITMRKPLSDTNR